MLLTFQGGRLVQRNKLVYHYYCDVQTNISVVVNGQITTYPYCQSSGNLLIDVGGNGPKLLPPPLLSGPPCDPSPFTELRFNKLEDAQLPSPGNVFMVSVDGPVTVNGSDAWLPGFNSKVLGASQISWFKDSPTTDPHDPNH